MSPSSMSCCTHFENEVEGAIMSDTDETPLNQSMP